jgi:polysaccharide pyruvyl transferase WcaK-like protein
MELKEFRLEREVRLMADPALALDVLSERQAPPENGREIRIGIIIRKTDGYQEFAGVLASVIHELIRKLNAKVFLIPFHPDLDEPVIDTLLEKLEERVEVFRWADLDQLLLFFSRLELVLSMRLHAAILAVLMKIPVIGISIDPKMDRFLQQVAVLPSGKRALNVRECSHDLLLSALLRCWEKRAEFKTSVESRIEVLRERARVEPLIEFCLSA